MKNKKYLIKEYSQEEFDNDNQIAFYTKFDENLYGFKYLVLIEDRKPFYMEKAVRAFVRHIRKNYELYGKHYMCIIAERNNWFCVGQTLDYIRYIKVD